MYFLEGEKARHLCPHTRGQVPHDSLRTKLGCWVASSARTVLVVILNPMDRGAWWAIVHGLTKELNPTQRLTLHRYCHVILISNFFNH